MDNSTCVVLVPVGNSVHRVCELGLRGLEAQGYEVRRLHGYAQIDAARSELASAALRDGFQELMWIDSDTGFYPSDVDTLRSHGLPLVAGICAKKGSRAVACHVVPGTTRLVFGEKGGLHPLLYAGTGFLLTHRSVYTDIAAKLELPTCNEHWGTPMVPYFQPMVVPHDGGHWYLSEDFSFCERARQVGHDVMADTTIRLVHYGDYGYRWEDAGGELSRYASYTLNLT